MVCEDVMDNLSHSCLFGDPGKIDVFSQWQVFAEAGQHHLPLVLCKTVDGHLMYECCQHIRREVSCTAHRAHHNHTAEKYMCSYRITVLSTIPINQIKLFNKITVYVYVYINNHYVSITVFVWFLGSPPGRKSCYDLTQA